MFYYQQDSHGRKREPVPTNCPLTSTVTQNKQKKINIKHKAWHGNIYL